MSNQAQIDAIEQLLMAVLKSSPFKPEVARIFEIANSALAGSDGPPGTSQKSEAANYLAHLKLQLK